MPPFAIRPVSDADVESAVQCLRRSITEGCIADHRNDARTLERWLSNKTPDHFRSWVGSSDSFIVVALIDGIVVGVGAMRRRGDLDLCYVHPSFQRNGIGRALLGALEQRACDWAVPALRLFSTLTARAFYEHHGYIFLPEESGPGDGVLYDYRYIKTLSEQPGEKRAPSGI